MANTLTFASPVALPALTTCKIVQAKNVSLSDATIVIDIEIFAEDGTSWGPYSLNVRNGACDCLRLPETGGRSIDDIVGVVTVTPDENPALAQAFSRVMGAFVAGGAENGMLDQMQQLGLLPAGATS